jgi:HSP20 family protein
MTVKRFIEYRIAFEHRVWQPSLNIYETDQMVLIVAEIAGVDPNALYIDAEPNTVRIHGVRHIAPPEGLQRIDRMEISAGPFELEIPIHVPIEPEQATSHYHQGLLEITLPRVRRPTQRLTIKMTGEGEREGDIEGESRE